MTTPVVTECEHCGKPIRLYYGTWLHVREDILANKPSCLDGSNTATPTER